MTPSPRPSATLRYERRAAAITGVALSLAVTVLAVLGMFMIGVARCASFFGENGWVSGTLNETLCNGRIAGLAFWGSQLLPLVLGVAGSIRAAKSGQVRHWAWPLGLGSLATLCYGGLLLVSPEL